MLQVMICWKVKPDEVRREVRALEAVYEEMRSVRPEGLRYATYQLEDTAVFMALVEMEDGLGVMEQLTVFQRYRAALDERCEEVPVVTMLNEVGAYNGR